MRTSVIVSYVFIMAVACQGCGIKKAADSMGEAMGTAMGNAIGQGITDALKKPTATASTTLSNFDLGGIHKVLIKVRDQTRAAKTKISATQGEALAITIIADGKTTKEIVHYLSGSIRDVQNDVLTITLGDRDITCVRQEQDGKLVGVQGVCLKDISVVLPPVGTADVEISSTAGANGPQCVRPNKTFELGSTTDRCGQ